MTGKSPNHYPWLLGTAAVAGVLFYLLGSILSPFLSAAILAYICNPLVNWLEKHKVPRSAGAVLVLLLLAGLFVALVLILLPLFQKEAALFVERLPALVDQEGHVGLRPGGHSQGRGQRVEVGHRSSTVCHLGNIAIRSGKKVVWDGPNMKAKNCPEADGYVRREYRTGWRL